MIRLRGYTLVELVAAMLIAGIISLASYEAIKIALQNLEERVHDKAAYGKDFRNSFLLSRISFQKDSAITLLNDSTILISTNTLSDSLVFTDSTAVVVYKLMKASRFPLARKRTIYVLNTE